MPGALTGENALGRLAELSSGSCEQLHFWLTHTTSIDAVGGVVLLSAAMAHELSVDEGVARSWVGPELVTWWLPADGDVAARAVALLESIDDVWDRGCNTLPGSATPEEVPVSAAVVEDAVTSEDLSRRLGAVLPEVFPGQAGLVSATALKAFLSNARRHSIDPVVPPVVAATLELRSRELCLAVLDRGVVSPGCLERLRDSKGGELEVVINNLPTCGGSLLFAAGTERLSFAAHQPAQHSSGTAVPGFAAVLRVRLAP